MANALVTAAVALSIALGVYMAIPRSNSDYSQTYVEALADFNAVDAPDIVGPVQWIFPSGQPSKRASMPKYKLSAVLSLLLVFLSGSVLGAVAYRLYMVNTVSGRRRCPQAAQDEPRRVPQALCRGVADQGEDGRPAGRAAPADSRSDPRAEFHKMRDKMNAEGEAIQTAQVEKINAILRRISVRSTRQLRAEREKQRNARPAAQAGQEDEDFEGK